MTRLTVLVHWIPALLVMAGIWVVSSFELPSGALEHVPFRDKGAHFLVYALLGAAVAHAVKCSWPKQTWLRTALLSVWITVAWGALDELHQALVPGRLADVTDLMADGVGAIVGASLRYAASPIVRRRAAEGSHS